MAINCSCDDTTGYATLAQLRRRLIVRLGWAAVADNPPPGVADLCNSFLTEAHALLWQRFPAIRTERWFTWPLTIGERFYDLTANAEQGAGPDQCTKLLDPYSLSEVLIENGTARYRVVHGIPSTSLSRTTSGWPSHFEVRQCIELWPAPAATEGTLLVRGRFQATAFSADADVPGLPEHMVFLLALANAKAHYKQPDAGNYIQQMETLLGDLMGGTHGTRRYVPGLTQASEAYVEPIPSEPFA